MQTWRPVRGLKEDCDKESPFNARQTPDEEPASVRAAKVAPRSQLQWSWWKVMARDKETADLNIGREER